VAYVKPSCIGWHERATVHGVTGDQDALTLRQWVGQAVRSLREQHGKRQDDVARSARTLGLTWTASKVAALERGDKALPAEELLLLPLVLAETQCGQPSLADLLPQGSGTVRLGDQTAMSAAVLAQVIRGEDIDIREVNSPSIRESFARIEKWVEEGGPRRSMAIFSATLEVSGRDSRELHAAERAAGDAERIAARRLGVPSLAIIAAALATWGHGLTQERDARAAQRAGPGASARTAQAARGHVTRELYRELAPALDRYHQAMANQGEES
jgi:transcriptional regulator with XRE-family HTH domain